MKSAAEDIKDKITGTLGLVFATNLFVGIEPNTPDICTTVFDVSGGDNTLDLDGNNAYEYPAVQIRLRGLSYTSVYTLGKSIETALNGLHGVTINGTVYTAILVKLPTTLLDYDNENRVRFIINLTIQRR